MISLTRKFLLSKKKNFLLVSGSKINTIYSCENEQFYHSLNSYAVNVWQVQTPICETLSWRASRTVLWGKYLESTLIGKAGRIGFRALTLVLSNRTTVLQLFNFLNMNVNTDRIRQCEVHFAVTKFWETNWLSEKDYHKKKLLTGRKR